MTGREKDEVRHVLRFYREQLMKACEKKDLPQAEMCRSRLWGACSLAELLRALTPEEVNEMDAWADDQLFALRRDHHTAGEEETPCREST